MNDDGNRQELSLERLDSLMYLDCVIKEVLRLAPPVDGAARTLTINDCLPGSGAHFYKGDQRFIPFYVLTQDSRLWSIDPKHFYPERFLDQDKDHRPYAFMPFGGGHGQCIG
ncbi:unnamed protein product [Rotaria sordida]|uniref:Cytochrome P450 n=1 Tax=Rotaria sordida TaxID=392033 RepID=A0A819E3K1_9BILA|nr:unnamed protein product [Rotaria sordida]CAF0850826.1 unnamed protein product [Rotaria sordida]CAF3843742.1 unnamed protein product [Rotaria sordida]CAF3904243.1 unnamed protein product [Rotaria sordida]